MSNYYIDSNDFWCSEEDRLMHWGNGGHKYLMKIGEGVKARYLYTQEEVAAYMGRGNKAANAAANKIRQRATSARKAISNTAAKASANKASIIKNARNVIDSAKKTPVKSISKVNSSAASTKSTVKTAISAAKKKTKEKARDIAGYDERDRLKAAMKETTRVGNASNWKQTQAYKNAVKNEEKAQRDYDKTPLGKIDMVKDYVGAAKYQARSVINRRKAK